MKKLIFIMLSLLGNGVLAAPIQLICTDTTPYNGVYRKIGISFDEARRFVQINGVDAKVVSMNNSSIVADAYGYRHVVDRITSEMTVFEVVNTSPQIVFNCALAGKRAF